VEAGTYEAGALNAQVWQSRMEAGNVDLEKVQVIWTTPPYHDYHWVLHPDALKRYGNDFADKIKAAFMKLDPSVPEHSEILKLFGAQKFIETQNSNYDQIEAIGRQIGKITD
jgi:phosphonate transport system substrate-binding protein